MNNICHKSYYGFLSAGNHPSLFARAHYDSSLLDVNPGQSVRYYGFCNKVKFAINFLNVTATVRISIYFILFV